ncbi:ECF RNA polymerase sigma factor SigK [Nocardia sp. BMG51109]|uniref:ECF RNA polymerase sigma factor SigK n=1 Tax=Nocardia sp. BMG51109 TaxID=1056816 RepID=UPI000465C790|nr:ECF RNA polymerase sigma factor SigK [Nocardia sp. BMG51109]
MTDDPGIVSLRLHDGAPPDTADPAPSCPVPGPDGDGNEGGQRELRLLLDATGTGDRDAFTRFYRATNPRVFGLALRIVRNRTAAEEITQEVYLQVWSTAYRFDPKRATPIGWLMMIAHRRAVDRVRTEKTAFHRDTVYGHTHLGRDHDVVEETVGQQLEEQAVVHCLDTLTSTQREAVALAYYSGRTYREVSQHLDVPLATIKSRIRDALKRLHTCLSGAVSHA